eukprot:2274653-Amphidinium_carterae.2
MCGLLLRSTYGTQDASQIWQKDYTYQTAWRRAVETRSVQRSLVLRRGHAGQSSRARRRLLTARQRRVDDVKRMDETLRFRYDCKSGGVLGPDPEDDTEATYLNRVIRRLTAHQSRSASTAGTACKRCREEQTNVPYRAGRLHEVQVWSDEPQMRIAYLSLDRPDLAHAVKCLSRHMQKPTQSNLADFMKRVGRYQHNHKCLVNVYNRQSWPGKVTETVDTVFVGDQVTRKSTTRVATFLGSHCVRTQSNLQSSVSLSSGEAEYYGTVKAMEMGFLMKSLLADFGIAVGTLVRGAVQEGVESSQTPQQHELLPKLWQRKGLGRQKHVHRAARQGAYARGYSGSREHGCQRTTGRVGAHCTGGSKLAKVTIDRKYGQ